HGTHPGSREPRCDCYTNIISSTRELRSGCLVPEGSVDDRNEPARTDAHKEENMTQKTRFAASVIIPTYNRRDMLMQNLASLASSDMPKDDFEIIVIDDGSSDGTF